MWKGLARSNAKYSFPPPENIQMSVCVSIISEIIRVFAPGLSERRIKEIWEGGKASHNPSTNALYTNKHCFP